MPFCGEVTLSMMLAEPACTDWMASSGVNSSVKSSAMRSAAVSRPGKVFVIWFIGRTSTPCRDGAAAGIAAQEPGRADVVGAAVLGDEDRKRRAERGYEQAYDCEAAAEHLWRCPSFVTERCQNEAEPWLRCAFIRRSATLTKDCTCRRG